MAQTLKTDLGIAKASLRIIADTRLRDFEALWKAGQFHSAVYMAGYAVEGYLKCAICKSLGTKHLPVVFEYHGLDSLLFFSGFGRRLRRITDVYASFLGIAGVWKVEMRYEDPNSSKINQLTCVDFNKWLNDTRQGVVPWLRTRI